MSPEEAPVIQYDAFISYSHAADGRLAPALRSGLQRFATPWRLFRLTNPVRSLRIFQDTASLSANPELWPTIERALMASKWFVLLASLDAANSPWVGKEVNFWCRHKSPTRLLIVQTAGEITWDGAINDFDWTKTDAIPQVLSGAFREEPRWVDARFARTKKQVTLRDPRFHDLVAEVAAPLRGIPKDDLIGEDIRQHRRLNFWRNAGVTFLAVLFIMATLLAVIAVQQRIKAERNLKYAVNAVDTLGTGVARRLRRLAGIEGLTAETVHQTLTDAEQNIRNVVAVAPNSPEVQNRLALMHIEFARTYATLGDTKKQMEQAQEANRILARFESQDSLEDTWRRDLGVSYCEVGNARHNQGDLTGAKDDYRHGLSLMEQLRSKEPGNNQWRQDLLSCFAMEYSVLNQQGDWEGTKRAWGSMKSIIHALNSETPNNTFEKHGFEANAQRIEFIQDVGQWSDVHNVNNLLSALESHQATMERLYNEDKTNPVRQSDLADAYITTARFFKLLAHNLDEALQAYRSAQTIIASLIAHDPNNAKWQGTLAETYEGIGHVLAVQSDLNGALEAYSRASPIIKRLAIQDPDYSDWQSALAENQSDIGLVLSSLNDYNGAFTAFRDAQQIMTSLNMKEPSNFVWQHTLMSIKAYIGNILTYNHDYAGALSAYYDAQNILENLVKNGHASLTSQLASVLHRIADVKSQQGDYNAALENLYNARTMLDDLASTGSSDRFIYLHLMSIHNAIGDALRAQGDLNNALVAYHTPRSIMGQSTAENQNGQTKYLGVLQLLQAELMKSDIGIGKVLKAQGNLAGALEAYRASEAIARSLVDQDVRKSLWQLYLVSTKTDVGLILTQEGDHASALHAYRDVETIYKNNLTKYPTDSNSLLGLARIQLPIGSSLWAEGDHEGALRAFRESIVLLRQQPSTIETDRSLTSALGMLSWYCLLAQEFSEAQGAATEGYSRDRQQLWILANLAHAEMFLGNVDTSMAIHKQYKNSEVVTNGIGKEWKKVVVEDFDAFKRAGLVSRHMPDIESLLATQD